MEKYFYTVGEVAEMIGESTSLVRFWANEFPKFIRPQRNAKGNRLFTNADVDVFKRLHVLIKVEGMTLEGAAKRLKEINGGAVTKARVLETLKGIRNQLQEIRQDL